MGKIRVKTFGIEAEEEQKKKQKERQEKKKTAKAPGLNGGAHERSEGASLPDKRRQRVAMVGPGEAEIAVNQPADGQKEGKLKTGNRKQKTDNRQKKLRSKRYQISARILDKTKVYTLTEALELLPGLKLSKFDETVELHINMEKTGVSGTISLPHGTGKKTRAAIATDELIERIEKGKIDFDVLLATPDMMPKLAKVAKILGPKGLMPNPKNGTISNKPGELIKKYEGGQISFRTEAKAPIIHMAVGKISFGPKKLAENIKTLLSAIKKEDIKNVILKSTMSPGIKLQIQKALTK